MELYGGDRKTIEDWKKNRGLEVSTYSKYITEMYLLDWENSLIGESSIKRLYIKVCQNKKNTRVDRLPCNRIIQPVYQYLKDEFSCN